MPVATLCPRCTYDLTFTFPLIVYLRAPGGSEAEVNFQGYLDPGYPV
jgi:hypothetical protein